MGFTNGSLGIGLVGCGTVGCAVAALLSKEQALLQTKFSGRIELRAVADVDFTRARQAGRGV